MQSIDHSTYEALRKGAHVLEADGSGDKVLRLADGRMLKLFRRKRLLSSALFYPYAQRFADNTRALEQRGILCPKVIAVYRIPSIERDGVYYSPLAGNTVRQLQGTVQSDQAQLDAAKLQLTHTRVVAPISGRLGLKQTELGSLVRAGDANGIVSINQTDPVEPLIKSETRKKPAPPKKHPDQHHRRHLELDAAVHLESLAIAHPAVVV